MRWLTRIAFAACLAACGLAWGQSTQPAPAPRPETLELVAQLGDKRWAVREAAHNKLLTTRDPGVVPALRQAAASNDTEKALRARELLASLLNFTHVVLDALGNPIADATIVFFVPESDTPALTLTTNMFGGLSLPPSEDRPHGRVRFYHKQFGSAQGPEPDSSSSDENENTPRQPIRLFVPLVAKDSPAYARALRGQVVGPDDKPAPGAEVAWQGVTAPDRDFPQPENVLDSVLADEDGRFALYLPDAKADGQKKDLIPLHAKYEVEVRAAGLFPCAEELDNTDPAVIRLPRPELFHRFEFETDDGGHTSGSTMGETSLVFHPAPDKNITLDAAYIRDGGKLMPGRYTVNAAAEYLPLDVTKDSPETLLFRLPPPLTYRGRVLDGTTGKPMAGAFVIAHSEDCCAKTIELTDADWTAMEALPTGLSKTAQALEALRKLYPFGALCRTDEQGRYEVVEPANARSAHLLAFARHRLPYSLQELRSQPAPADKSPLRDLHLFPAARVTLHPSSSADMSVTPRWEFPPDGQPEWFSRYQDVSRIPRTEARIGCIHPTPSNTPHTFYVPAGLRVTVAVHPPNDEEFCIARLDKPIQLPPGGCLDIGKFTLDPAPSLTIRVTGPDGKPLPGVPVQRLYIPEEVWSSARLTDSDGLVRFPVQRNSRGYFSLFNPVRTALVRAHPGLATIPFQFDTTAPSSPLSLPLTALQSQPFLPHPAPPPAVGE